MPSSVSIRHALPREALRSSVLWPWSLAGLALVWSYAATIGSLMSEWRRDPNYSVGMLVLPMAVYLAWQHRDRLRGLAVRPSWWGLGLLMGAQLVRAAGVLLLFESAERYSLVLSIMGLTLLLAGVQIWRRMFWLQMFLFLMVPLPGKIHYLVCSPMQKIATSGAVVLLELLGVSVVREGHVMVLNGSTPVAVAEACSGLRMLTAFVVVACVLAVAVRRPAWQKGALVISSVGVAIACNIVRLVATALLFAVVNAELAKTFFHDFAGWTMMPLAIVLLFGELWLLSRLVVSDDSKARSASL